MPDEIAKNDEKTPNTKILVGDEDTIIKQLNSFVNTSKINNMVKTASVDGSVSPDFMNVPLLYTDPLYDPILFLFPKDRIEEINKRLRHYYETEPIVGSAIDLHTNLPLSDFSLSCVNQEYQAYWNNWKDRVHLIDFLRKLVFDYWLLGEGIGMPVWDDFNMEISHFVQFPPENIDIHQTYVTPKKIFMLKPDEKIAKKVSSSSPEDMVLVNSMDPEFVAAVKSNKNYFLGTDDTVIYLARATSNYKARGISLLSRCVKDLLYKNKLRLLQLAFCDRHSRPLKIFKLGSESKGWMPSDEHFMAFRDLLAQTVNDPDPTIVWNFAVSVDYVGTSEKVMNLIHEFDWIDKQVMAALFVNEDMIHGNSPASVRDTVSMRILMLRYNDLREKIENILISHIFLPIARARKMYKNERVAREMENRMVKYASTNNIKISRNAIKNNSVFLRANGSSLDIDAFDIPKPIWKKINIFNNTAEQQLIINLEEKGKLPFETVLDVLGLDPKTISKKLKDQEGTIFDPVYRQIREEISKSEDFRAQVLSGKKTEELVIPEGSKIKPNISKLDSGPGSFDGLSDLGFSGLGMDSLGDLSNEPKMEGSDIDLGGGGIGGTMPSLSESVSAPSADISAPGGPSSMPSMPSIPSSSSSPINDLAPGKKEI